MTKKNNSSITTTNDGETGYIGIIANFILRVLKCLKRNNYNVEMEKMRRAKSKETEKKIHTKKFIRTKEANRKL